jgi:hypothetical protein
MNILNHLTKGSAKSKKLLDFTLRTYVPTGGASQGFVDLRSDTITRPSPKMREAMKNAIVGDDVYRDDPTLNKL